ncbi:GNAT family N-acetyltransferase [Georgenia sp. SUBG003]|uniref:GNAT family N-acetyltransferase n=1 Tax=Georgenia sp. SUBG003 TaxID=1497974 RepID=UPI0004D3C72A|nr:hypothetical protein DA06_12030 [Georgenia sp. SUBG003]
METTVREGENRFEILVDDEVVGVAEYLDDGERRIFHRTRVDDAMSGKGLAGRLVGHALDEARDEGRRVVPVCSYVAAYVERHEQYADLVEPASDDDGDLVAARS